MSPERGPLGLTYSDGGIPVFHPTMEEFKDFAQFVKRVDKYGMETGIVKVVPPKEWVDSRPQLDEAVKSIKIKNPIIQDVNGTGGLYRLQNIEKQRTYDLFGWRKICQDSENQPPAKRGERRKKDKTQQQAHPVDYRFDDKEFTPERCQELEKTYWRSLTYSSAMYGADMPGSLFDDTCTIWNVAHLDNILNSLKIQIPGVNTAYLYCGMWKSTFAWHLEDMDLYSINYIHFGAPKQWYSISQKDKDRFFEVMKEMWPEEYKNCKEFLRHKTFNASPALLEQHGIKVNKVIHNQNEFMITFPYGYHSGFNFDYNVAESVNFATETWLPFGKTAKKCICVDDSVGIDVPQLVRWMEGKGDDDNTSAGEEENEMRPSTNNLPTPPYEEEKRQKNKKKPTMANRKKNGDRLIETTQPITCELCPDMFDQDMVKNQKGKTVHRICANLNPETGVTDAGSLIGLERIPKERTLLKCYQCGVSKGACIKCSESKCSRSYHATCAIPAGVLEIRKGRNRPSEYLCRFHRPKRPTKLELLESDGQLQHFAYCLLPEDVVQCQLGTGDIFGGVVDHNNLSENTAVIRVLPSQEDLIEVEWKWIRFPYIMGVLDDADTTTAKKNSSNNANSNKSVVVPKKRKFEQFAPNGEKIQFTGFKKEELVNTNIETIDKVTWVIDESTNKGLNPCQPYFNFLLYRPNVSTMSTDLYGS